MWGFACKHNSSETSKSEFQTENTDRKRKDPRCVMFNPILPIGHTWPVVNVEFGPQNPKITWIWGFHWHYISIKNIAVIGEEVFLFHSQICEFVMDIKTKNICQMRKDHGLWGCNYFYPMAYMFYTITSFKSEKIRKSLHFAARHVYHYDCGNNRK